MNAMVDVNYLISFRRIQDELRCQKSLYYYQYANVSEWEWLCKNYLDQELIADYDDVEWACYNINAANLPEKMAFINNAAETMRLLTYMRDNAQNFFSDSEIGAVEEFENAVCARITAMIGNIGENNEPDILSDLRMIAEKGVSRKNKDAIASLNTSSRIIATHLPPTNDDPRLDVFHYDSVIRVSRLFLHDFIETIDHAKNNCKELVVNDYLDKDKLSQRIEIALSKAENRLLLGKTQPIAQVLFALCIYLEVDPIAERWREFCDRYRAFIISCLSQQYKIKRINHKLDLCKQELEQPISETILTLDTSAIQETSAISETPSAAKSSQPLQPIPNLELPKLRKNGKLNCSAIYDYIRTRIRHDPDFKEYCQYNSIADVCLSLRDTFGYDVNDNSLRHFMNRRRLPDFKAIK